MPADEPQPTWADDDEPDPSLLWKWVYDAVRPNVGWILIGSGAFVMLLGYFGVSREAIPAKQIPYLVSGGIGGIFLAVLGAYFLGTQEIRNDSGRLDRLEHMVEELHLALLRRPDAPQIQATDLDEAAVGANGSAGMARRVLIVGEGETFHRTTCPLIVGKDTEDLTPVIARKRGLRPCPACTPVPSAAAS